MIKKKESKLRTYFKFKISLKGETYLCPVNKFQYRKKVKLNLESVLII